jgi:flagellar hook assembly protein FlgD
VRRGVVAAVMLALFVIALGIFLIPFAFPTPPPIVTRFQSTQLFSPNGDGRRDVARVNIRLHEPSDVTVEIQKDGNPVMTLVDGERRQKGFESTEFFGRDRLGRLLPDGTYAIKLIARSGDKKFEKSRKIVLDTTAPRIDELSVTSATLAGPGRGECRVALTATDPGSVVLQARPAGGGEAVRRLGARPVRADGTVRWLWDGTDADGRDVPPGLYVIDASLSDAARNRDEQVATCWVGRMAGAPVPDDPRPRDRVRVRLRGTDGARVAPSTRIALTLRRRTGTPGQNLGDPLGEQVGGGAKGPAGTVSVRIPPGINPAALWLVATTLDGHAQALIDLRG